MSEVSGRVFDERVDFAELESKVRQVVLQGEQLREAIATEREARRELLETVLDLMDSEGLVLSRGLRRDVFDLVESRQDREALETAASELERRCSPVASKVRAICTLAWGAPR